MFQGSLCAQQILNVLCTLVWVQSGACILPISHVFEFQCFDRRTRDDQTVRLLVLDVAMGSIEIQHMLARRVGRQ